MEKNFKFRLEALLKLKKFNEEKKKISLGITVQEIKNIEDEMKEIRKQMLEAWEQSDAVVVKGTRASVLSYFPYILEGLKEEWVKRYKRREELFLIQKEKIDEVNKARGDVKVLTEIKEKDFVQFKKLRNRFEETNIQDLILMNSSYLKRNNDEGN